MISIIDLNVPISATVPGISKIIALRKMHGKQKSIVRFLLSYPRSQRKMNRKAFSRTKKGKIIVAIESIKAVNKTTKAIKRAVANGMSII